MKKYISAVMLVGLLLSGVACESVSSNGTAPQLNRVDPATGARGDIVSFVTETICEDCTYYIGGEEVTVVSSQELTVVSSPSALTTTTSENVIYVEVPLDCQSSDVCSYKAQVVNKQDQSSNLVDFSVVNQAAVVSVPTEPIVSGDPVVTTDPITPVETLDPVITIEPLRPMLPSKIFTVDDVKLPKPSVETTTDLMAKYPAIFEAAGNIAYYAKSEGYDPSIHDKEGTKNVYLLSSRSGKLVVMHKEANMDKWSSEVQEYPLQIGGDKEFASVYNPTLAETWIFFVDGEEGKPKKLRRLVIDQQGSLKSGTDADTLTSMFEYEGGLQAIFNEKTGSVLLAARTIGGALHVLVWNFSAEKSITSFSSNEYKSFLMKNIIKGRASLVTQPITGETWVFAQSEDSFLRWYSFDDRATFQSPIEGTRLGIQTINSSPVAIVNKPFDNVEIFATSGTSKQVYHWYWLAHGDEWGDEKVDTQSVQVVAEKYVSPTEVIYGAHEEITALSLQDDTLSAFYNSYNNHIYVFGRKKNLTLGTLTWDGQQWFVENAFKPLKIAGTSSAFYNPRNSQVHVYSLARKHEGYKYPIVHDYWDPTSKWGTTQNPHADFFGPVTSFDSAPHVLFHGAVQ